ncbi:MULTISPECIES: LysR family transcriptional regulator [Achromobacter]|uniref:HTH-type transcriptional regulator PgrR n=2 Tax=Achromobacter piechaudii TaxID=72556 RepID=A0A6S7E423_9BURK|nr:MULTISPECIES: LysR family transcriptional regulator [Achromobacter]EFF73954.1 LysR substrate binding domain protein [Achromobacter piechaudii ATCC 43553]MPS81310.1 LysR family transcriptional regulator [Achromobacter sp.]CAB3739309.1 HTH-type transcriptional regulator PgrR [Achromobacter piechaudii]CAB3895067.1 HTH-type transcriptional regulator PgrR [Achromobacter piechaudii]CAB3919387.1 HTH-type transcriptional regulator PgrR [Achromobacter piechaudii]
MTTSLFAPSISPSAPGADSLADSFATSYSGVVAFIAVAVEGNFAKAGDRLGIGRSAVSRSVQKLEDQLGTRLFVRTTRTTSLTAEGRQFYEQCHPGVARIVQALDNMRELREGPPSGLLRVCSTVGFGRKVVAPLLQGFCREHPGIAVELWLDDAPTDFAAERVDVSFRNGRMEDSQVIAKKIIPMQMLLCASPAYAAAHGLPACVDDIARHRCVNFRLASGRIYEWEFKVAGTLRKVAPPAMLSFNDADLVLQAVLDGHGMAQMAGYQVGEHLRAGTLVACLPQYAPDDRGHYLCFLSRQHLPARMRVFIDYMTEHIRAQTPQILESPLHEAA